MVPSGMAEESEGEAQDFRTHSRIVAWWQDDRIRYWADVHVAMAVAVEDGLITPIIRHADRKTLREIGAEAKDLALRARERKLKPEEYTGGTFSVSNLGMFDIDEFTAIINPPEAGILAVGRISRCPATTGSSTGPPARSSCGRWCGCWRTRWGWCGRRAGQGPESRVQPLTLDPGLWTLDSLLINTRKTWLNST